MTGAEAITAIQLADACIGIVKAIISIGQAARDAHGLPDDLAELFEQFPAVQDLFERAKANNDSIADGSRESADAVLTRCKEALDRMQTLFEKICPQDSANRAKRIWKGTKAAVFGRNSELQRLWKDIEGYLDILEKKGVFAIEDKLDQMRDILDSLADHEGSENVHYGSGNLNVNNGGKSFNTGGGSGNTYTRNFGTTNIYLWQHNIDSRNHKCLMTLTFPDFKRRSGLTAKTEGTCDWVSRHPAYRDWLEKGGLLWINGKPGSGKSTIMESLLSQGNALIREAVRDNASIKPDKFIASFFFDRRGQDLQHSKVGLFRSLLHQILDCDTTLLSDFCDVTGFDGSVDWCWTESDLRENLTKVILSFTRTRVLQLHVDALDESGETVAIELMAYFDRLLIASPSRLIICVSCRPWPDVIWKYDHCIIVEAGNREDIETYLRSRFEHAVHGTNKTGLSEVAKHIETRASGVFQWAVLVTNHAIALRKAKKAHILEAIQKTPHELGALYESMLSHLHEPGMEIERERALIILRWITFAVRPLTPEELRHAVATNPNPLPRTGTNRKTSIHWCTDDDEILERVFRLSQGLVSVAIDVHGKSSLQFDHESIRRYMTDRGVSYLESRARALSPGSVLGGTHHFLLLVCLRHLETIASEDKAHNREQHEITRKRAFVMYAAEHCVDHAQTAESQGIPQDDIIAFTAWPSNKVWAEREWLVTNRFLPVPFQEFQRTTLQHIACMYGLHSVLSMLVSLCGEGRFEPGNYGSLPTRRTVDDDSITLRDYMGRTPLSYAAEAGDERAVKLLLDAGLSVPYSESRHGVTPWDFAALGDHSAVMGLLSQKGHEFSAISRNVDLVLDKVLGLPPRMNP